MHARQINVVYNPADFSALENEWEALCEELAEEITVFASFQWYWTWWRHYAGEAALHLVVMRVGGKLVGIAPLMRRRAKIHGLPATILCFIENNLSLHNELIVLPAYREEFLQELLRQLHEDAGSWDAVVFRNLPESSPNRLLLTELLEGFGNRYLQNPAWLQSPYLVPGGSWEEYLASRTLRARKSLRNIRNSVHNAGSAEVRRIRGKEEFRAVRDDFFEVTRKSWAGNSGDPLSTADNEVFYHELADLAAEKGWLSAWTLRLDGRTIAVEFHLRAFGKEHAMRGHYLPEFASLSPGTYLEMEILRQVFEEPERPGLYDFGGAFDDYKRKWTQSGVPHVDLLVFNGRPYSRLLGFHESTAVPYLRQAFPKDFWNNRLFRLCGINTRRMG
ncbi:MAG TPA: GNAT family N-acetyltransferase [Geomonas sp.]|nr:GNAT family N-acetyltransferase [Geomonas sp.]